MTFKISFTLADGSEDSVLVQGESIAEVREHAQATIESRGGIDTWSQEVAAQ